MTIVDPRPLPQAAQSCEPTILDAFTSDCAPGHVIGSTSSSGAARRGIDRDAILSVDHGALRIGHVRRFGWNRQGIAYGPYERRNGLAFAAFALNGHNSSQTEVDFFRNPRNRIRHLGLGLLRRTLDGLPRGLISPALDAWIRKRLSHHHWPKIQDNFSAGWYATERPSGPGQVENAFVVRAEGVRNGDLRARIGGDFTPVLTGLQNVPLYYIVVLRQRGAAYYVSTPPSVPGAVAYPDMRLLAIDPSHTGTPLHAGIHQLITGEVGWRVDTRVYGLQVAEIPQWTSWYGSAVSADPLEGNGALKDSAAERGGRWSVLRGDYQRTASGSQARCDDSLAAVFSERSPGHVHVVLVAGHGETEAGLAWRIEDADHHWGFVLSRAGCELFIVLDGTRHVVARDGSCRLAAGREHSLQVSDDGRRFVCMVDGRAVFKDTSEDARLGDGRGVGPYTSRIDPTGAATFRWFEAHGRVVPLPDALRLGSPWSQFGQEVLVTDRFAGPKANLEGARTTTGDRIWKRIIGKGTFELTGDSSVRVSASPASPNPGRTAYGMDWGNPCLADVEVRVIPAGTGPRQEQKPRGGLIFWQDEDNYLAINNYIDDWFVGRSLSSFFRLNGKDDLFQAVWSNVGDRIAWGVPHVLRIVFDGDRYRCYLDGELVLYRALTDVCPNIRPLRINKVGLLANWEFGDDTGTEFRNFVARG